MTVEEFYNYCKEHGKENNELFTFGYTQEAVTKEDIDFCPDRVIVYH